jgi:hypothetical protein
VENRKSIADLVGPWVDSDFRSGLILRCKVAWNKPLEELTNLELATFLDQDIGVGHILPIAQDRIARKIDDGTEWSEGHLCASIAQAVDKQRQI